MNKKQIGKLFGEVKKSSFESLAAQWESEKGWKENSQNIALELLDFLDENDLTQRSFAEMMGVSPQVINKWLKGQENFTLETIAKMEKVTKRKLIRVVSEPVFHAAITEETIFIQTIYEKAPTASSANFKQAKIVPLRAEKYLLANVN